MKQSTISIIIMFSLFSTLYPQVKSKTPVQQRQSFEGIDILPKAGNADNSLLQNNHFQMSNKNSLAQTYNPPTNISKFPFQNANYSYRNSCPLVRSDGKLQVFWTNPSSDTLYSSVSNDGGITWSNPQFVFKSNFYRELSSVRTSTGRIMILWRKFQSLVSIYSDNNGATWSSENSVASDSSLYYLYGNSLNMTSDGKLWVFYSKYQNNNYDLYYKTSTDNGLTWSEEIIFSNDPTESEYGCSILNVSSSIIAVFAKTIQGSYQLFKRVSNDGGISWGTPTQIFSTSGIEFRPRLVKATDGTIWLLFEKYKPTLVPGYTQSEIVYSKSTDNGIIWSNTVDFTRYGGYDGTHNIVIFNEKPFITFFSRRWSNSIYTTQIWYGTAGESIDNSLPPALLNDQFISSMDTLWFRAYVTDETGIFTVRVYYSINGQPYNSKQMFDDGLHNDLNPNDYIYGADISGLQYFDQVDFYYEITDLENNIVNVYGYYSNYKKPIIHNAGNLILALMDNSGLGEKSASQTSGYWPKINGFDYLYYGSLWVGTNIGGNRLVADNSYGYAGSEDWRRIPNSPVFVGPGTSTQDISFYYEDSYQVPRIGLEVKQQSYQWADTTRDDFIMLKYTIKNNGLNGNLSNVFPTLFLDPDVAIQTDAYSNQVGYDVNRKMAYIFSSINNPGGYFGVRILNKDPHTVRFYCNGTDPSSDSARYSYMTSGINTPPADVCDHRILLTSQPVSLSVGQETSVYYGIVMGEGLADLQKNVDTMISVYNRTLTGISDDNVNNVPKEFTLYQNYPNPFNPSTTIKFALPERAKVNLSIYNLLGEKVAELVNGELTAGYHEVAFSAKDLPSGVYFYELYSGAFSKVKKMILLK